MRVGTARDREQARQGALVHYTNHSLPTATYPHDPRRRSVTLPHPVPRVAVSYPTRAAAYTHCISACRLAMAMAHAGQLHTCIRGAVAGASPQPRGQALTSATLLAASLPPSPLLLSRAAQRPGVRRRNDARVRQLRPVGAALATRPPSLSSWRRRHPRSR